MRTSRIIEFDANDDKACALVTALANLDGVTVSTPNGLPQNTPRMVRIVELDANDDTAVHLFERLVQLDDVTIHL